MKGNISTSDSAFRASIRCSGRSIYEADIRCLRWKVWLVRSASGSLMRAWVAVFSLAKYFRIYCRRQIQQQRAIIDLLSRLRRVFYIWEWCDVRLAAFRKKTWLLPAAPIAPLSGFDSFWSNCICRAKSAERLSICFWVTRKGDNFHCILLFPRCFRFLYVFQRRRNLQSAAQRCVVLPKNLCMYKNSSD